MSKKIISLVLAMMLMITMVTIGMVGASAAESSVQTGAQPYLTLNATSNYFPATTSYYDETTNEVTVTYSFQSSKRVLNYQWYLTYDADVLSLSSKNTPFTVSPVVGVNGGVLNMGDSGRIIGNATNLGLYNFTSMSTFVSIVFDVKDLTNTKPVTSTIDLDLDVLSVSELGPDYMTDTTKEVVLVDDSIVFDNELTDTVDVNRETTLTESTAESEPATTVVPTTEVPTTAVVTDAPTEAPTTAVVTEAPTTVVVTDAPTVAPTTEVSTEETTAQPTEAPTEVTTAEPTEAPTQAPTTAVVTDAPTQAPTTTVIVAPTDAPATTIADTTEVPTAATNGTSVTDATGATVNGGSTADTPNDNGAVQTGDASLAVIILTLLVAATGVMFVLRKREML